MPGPGDTAVADAWQTAVAQSGTDLAGPASAAIYPSVLLLTIPFACRIAHNHSRS